MSGELQISQFRYTTTKNNDFVIGDPAIPTGTKYLVFQVNGTPGYTSNPHIRAEYNSLLTTWELKWSSNGTTVSQFATTDAVNTWTALNSFNADVNLGDTFSDTITVNGTTTFNSPVTIASDLTVTGTTTNLNVTNVSSYDKLITLNKSGIAASGNGSGIEIEENAIITGYASTSADRNSWQFKAPNKAGIFTLTNAAASTTIVATSTVDRTLTLPNKTGTIACLDDISASFSLGNNIAVVTNGSGIPVSSTTTALEISYVSGVTGSIQGQLNAKAGLAGATFTGTVNLNAATNVANNTLFTFTKPSAQQIRLYTAATTGDFNIYDSVNSVSFLRYVSSTGAAGTLYVGNGSALAIDVSTSSITAVSFVGNHVSGSLLGATLPTLAGAADDKKTLIFNNGTTSWTTATVTTLDTNQTISANKTFTNGIYLHDSVLNTDFHMFMSNGVLTIV